MADTTIKRWDQSANSGNGAWEAVYPETTVSQLIATGDRNSGTFLRGDGVFSDTLTDDLTLDSADLILTSGSYQHIARSSYITFYGDNSPNHSIASRNATYGSDDDLRINTYGSLYINLDSNNNNSSDANFKIGRHGGTQTLSDFLLTLDGENGDLQATSFSSDGNSKFYTWRAINNTSSGGAGYYRIANISGSQSTRFQIEVTGRYQGYGDGNLPNFGKIIGQLNNDNNYDVWFFNNKTGTSEPIQEVGTVDDGNNNVFIWIKVSSFSEVAATAVITDGNITVYGDDSHTSSAPTGYTAVGAEYKMWNAGNDGSGSGLDADLLDGQEGSYYLDYNNFTNTPTISSNADTLDSLNSTQFLRSDTADTATGDITFTGNIVADGQIRSNTPSNNIAPINVKSDGEDQAIHIEENNGTESWQIGVDVDGDLNFYNSGSATPAIQFYDDNSVSFPETVTMTRLQTTGNQDRTKVRLWSGGTYGIGMHSGFTYGGLGATGGEYALTFQMNDDDDRGFWWGDSVHTTAQGAMALTTAGQLTVADKIRVGYGQSDTTTPANYAVDASGDILIADSNPVLQLKDTDTSGSAYIDYQGGTSLKVHAGSDPIVFIAGNSEKARLTAGNGNLGIGTTNPSEKIEAVGNIKASSSGNANIYAQRTSGATVNMQSQATKGVIGTDSNHDLQLKTNATAHLTIDTSGNTVLNGNLTLEDHFLNVGNVGDDNFSRFEHTEADGFGFDFQYNNASTIQNLQGTTNQALVLGDLSNNDTRTLFGASILSSGTWIKKLNLTGGGDLYIGQTGTDKVATEAYVTANAGGGTLSTSLIETATTSNTSVAISGFSSSDAIIVIRARQFAIAPAVYVGKISDITTSSLYKHTITSGSSTLVRYYRSSTAILFSSFATSVSVDCYELEVS